MLSLRATPLCLALLVIGSLLVSPVSAAPHVPDAPAKQLVDGSWRFGLENVPAKQPDVPQPAARSNILEPWARMVYTSYLNGNAEIYLYSGYVSGNTTGTVTKRLTTASSSDTMPRLNRTADRVVFVSDRDGNREIYRVDALGQGLARLTASAAGDIQPVWSPDGSRIAFASNRSGDWNIYVMGADGTGLTQLTSDPAPDLTPSWSPDATTIVWVRAGNTTGALWSMTPAGGNQRALTQGLRYLENPSWSPDGTRLAFDYDSTGDGFNEPALINADGTGLQSVPVTPNSYTQGTPHDIVVGGWSPEGERLLVTVLLYRQRPSGLELSNAFVSRVDIVGGPPEIFIVPLGPDMYPDMRSLDLALPYSQVGPMQRYTRGNSVELTWIGEDVGVAQKVVFDVQYRLGSGGTWNVWKSRTPEYKATFTAEEGATVYFRVRAVDDAGNTEPWRDIATGDAATTFYRRTVAGLVTDNRGFAAADTEVAFGPTAVAARGPDEAGVYQAWLAKDGTYTVTPSAPGFGAGPATSLALAQDASFSPYLPPVDNQVRNGDFEQSTAGLLSWTAGGTLPANVSLAHGTGVRSAQLGQPCSASCLSDGVMLADLKGEPINMAVDSDGQLHVITKVVGYIGGEFSSQLVYRMRSPQGLWSAGTNLGDGYGAKIAVDHDLMVHVVYATPSERLIYLQRPAGGSWAAPEDVALSSRAPELVVDPAGRVFVVYSCYSTPGCANDGTGDYAVRVPGRGWLYGARLPSQSGTLAVGPTGTVVVVWSAYNFGYTASISPDGTLGAVRRFGVPEITVWPPRAAVDSQGLLHIVWGSSVNETYYVRELPGGDFTAPERLSGGGESVYIVGQRGVLYMIYVGSSLGPPGIYYRVQHMSGEWSAPRNMYGLSFTRVIVAADDAGRLHIIRDGDVNPQTSAPGLYHYATVDVPAAGHASLTQSVTLPAGMHRPTLAFDYALGGVTQASGSRLDVLVGAGAGQTAVYSTTLSGGWAHAWVDMAPWAGSTVSVTFRLEQAAGVPAASALLDDVTLGSWRTPVIRQVALTQPVAGAPRTITISGSNFLDGATVRLGGRALPGVQRTGESTLHADIPADLPPGRYDVVVTNAGGAAARVSQVLVGVETFLPRIGR